MKHAATRTLMAILLITLAACSTTSSTTTVDKQEPDLKEASKLNVELALGYIKREQLGVAQEKLDKAIKEDPKNLDAFTTMAYLKTLIGEYQEAVNFYLDALDIKPSDPGLHNSYGGLLCEMGKYDDGLKEISLAYENPFYETPYLAFANAGTCYLKQGNLQQAELMLRKALRVNPDYTGALLSMAEIGIDSKKYLMARAYIQRYHAKVKPTAESLWIQIQAEKALGDNAHYLKYAKLLLNEFPDSQEAGLLHELARDERTQH
jgi:type IV pilus assembly protein PilF